MKTAVITPKQDRQLVTTLNISRAERGCTVSARYDRTWADLVYACIPEELPKEPEAFHGEDAFKKECKKESDDLFYLRHYTFPKEIKDALLNLQCFIREIPNRRFHTSESPTQPTTGEYRIREDLDSNGYTGSNIGTITVYLYKWLKCGFLKYNGGYYRNPEYKKVGCHFIKVAA